MKLGVYYDSLRSSRVFEPEDEPPIQRLGDRLDSTAQNAKPANNPRSETDKKETTEKRKGEKRKGVRNTKMMPERLGMKERGTSTLTFGEEGKIFCQVTALMIASQHKNRVFVEDLESIEIEQTLDGEVAPIHIVSEKEIARR